MRGWIYFPLLLVALSTHGSFSTPIPPVVPPSEACQQLTAGDWAMGRLVSRFSAARRDIGLSVLDSRQRTAVRDFGKHFMEFYSGSYVFPAPGTYHRHLAYMAVWKCGNDNIRLNLQKATGGGRSNQKFTYYTDYKDLTRIVNKKYKSTPVLFTFVRNPISRFIAGVAESFYRSVHQKNTIAYGHATASKSILISLFQILLDGDFRNGSITFPEHVFPMSNIFQHANPHFIGRLENFSNGWRAVESLYGLKLPYDKSYGYHRSSRDPNRVRSVLKEMLAEDPAYLRILCRVYFTDFVCFKYPFPEECIDLPIVRNYLHNRSSED
jgi:hypothetical protein